MRTLLALTLTIWLTSCAATSSGNECSWVKKIYPETDPLNRWTEAEIRAVAAHNRKVEEFCR